MKCTISVALLIAIVLPLIILLVFLMVPVDILADETNTTVIEVNISEVTAITVTPDNLAWADLTPGANGSVQNISIENVGSKTFSTGIYVSVDSFANATPNPTPGTSTDAYKAGSFLVVSNSTHFANDEWWFVNQMSWNESTYGDPTGATATADAWGWFHNESQRWLWELKGNDTGQCNMGTDADAVLKIQPTEDSNSLTAATSADYLCNNSDWAVWGISTGPLQGYAIAADVDCEYLMIYKFDMNSSLPSCGNRTYLVPGSFSPGVGNKKTVEVKPNIPDGILAGTVTNSTVTFTAVA